MVPIYSFVHQGLEIDIYPMTYEIAKEWHDNIQPIIALDNKRADKNWNWKINYGLKYVYSILLQDVRGYAVYIDGILIGMMLAAINYSCKENGMKIPSYLWYITKSPDLRSIEDDTSKKNGTKVRIPFLKLMSKVLHDEISSKYNKKQKTQLTHWLHSDPNGGQLLRNQYISYGYLPCELGLDKVVSARVGIRSNYFYYPIEVYNKIQKESNTFKANGG